jgi:hypothetical protein
LLARLSWREVVINEVGQEWTVNIFRIVHYYPNQVDGGPRPGRAGGLGLVRAVSVPLADGLQLDGVPEPERTAIVAQLYAGDPTGMQDGAVRPPVRLAWRRDRMLHIEGGLVAIHQDGSIEGHIEPPDDDEGMLPLHKTLTPTGVAAVEHLKAVARSIPLDAERSIPDMITIRHHSLVSSHAGGTLAAGLFAGSEQPAGEVVPAALGFEVQVVGMRRARKAMLHTLLMRNHRLGAPPRAAMTSVVDNREF